MTESMDIDSETANLTLEQLYAKGEQAKFVVDRQSRWVEILSNQLQEAQQQPTQLPDTIQKLTAQLQEAKDGLERYVTILGQLELRARDSAQAVNINNRRPLQRRLKLHRLHKFLHLLCLIQHNLLEDLDLPLTVVSQWVV